LADGRKMIRDEDESPLSEEYIHNIDNFPTNEENEKK
jgi:hydrophobic/amphiphilic exporter-1 (mainly G- bacteria), HAE1 family